MMALTWCYIIVELPSLRTSTSLVLAAMAAMADSPDHAEGCVLWAAVGSSVHARLIKQRFFGLDNFTEYIWNTLKYWWPYRIYHVLPMARVVRSSLRDKATNEHMWIYEQQYSANICVPRIWAPRVQRLMIVRAAKGNGFRGICVSLFGNVNYIQVVWWFNFYLNLSIMCYGPIWDLFMYPLVN